MYYPRKQFPFVTSLKISTHATSALNLKTLYPYTLIVTLLDLVFCYGMLTDGPTLKFAQSCPDVRHKDGTAQRFLL